MSVTFADIQAAAGRIAGVARRSPVIEVGPSRAPLAGPARVFLKLDCLQPSGSFKIRGAANTVASLPAADLARGLVTASGGNHGLAVTHAAAARGAPAVIYLPTSTPAAKADKLRALGAEVVIHGPVWDAANAAALDRAEDDGLTYVHPFADPRVIAGQGTAAVEFLADVPALDVLLIAVGGGGLLAGVATAAAHLKPSLRVIGGEPVGAATPHDSMAAGRPVQLAEITTRAGSLAPRQSTSVNLNLIQAHCEGIVLVDDAAMLAAARWLWEELGIAAEMAAAAGIAALAEGRGGGLDGAQVGVLVCGAGDDGIVAA